MNVVFCVGGQRAIRKVIKSHAAALSKASHYLVIGNGRMWTRGAFPGEMSQVARLFKIWQYRDASSLHFDLRREEAGSSRGGVSSSLLRSFPKA